MNTKLFNALQAEKALFAVVVANHRARMDAIIDRKNQIESVVYDTFGFHPCELPGTFPQWMECAKELEALGNDDGYYWACSRLIDLQLILDREQVSFVTRGEYGWRPWTLNGDIPDTHPKAIEFLSGKAA